MKWSQIKRWAGLGCVLGMLGCTHLMPPEQASLPQQQKDRVECKALSQQGAGEPGTLFRETIAARLYIECMESRGWHKE
jgi:hypothetical protein